ncbi:unnamed protein product [Effrenium voratum]|nr:unnamed protein product [Effrenium voratum]
MIMPPWFLDLTDEVCRACGVTTRPNSCNANLYEDGSESVGWHADDEPCFDAKRCDALIISLSLGATRTFVLRPNDDQMSQTRLALANGDLCTMEGKELRMALSPWQRGSSRQAAPGLAWPELLAELRENLRADPSFSGPWVHELCSSTYAAFFAAVRLDEVSFQLTKGPCGAGLLAVAAVCSQSAALQMKNISRWRRTERPVQDEGAAVRDVLEAMPAADCLRLCEEHQECASVAHGPFGCHLKDRCVSGVDELVAPGRAEGYSTYYRSGGRCQTLDAQPTYLDEKYLSDVRLLMDYAVRLLDHVVHCLEESDWPFSVAEVLSNRMELIAATLHAQRHGGHEMTFQWSRMPRFTMPFSCDASMRAAEGKAGSVCRTLDRLLIRWVRGLDSEVGFWHALLDPANRENPEVDAAAWETAKDWLRDGVVSWHYGDICAFLEAARGLQDYGHPRVLNAGSGPLAPGHIDCGRAVPVIATDGLARFYLQLFDMLQHEPPAVPVQCPTESLHECFPRHHFDVAHVRNSLDHANDPLQGILKLLWVVRPGGWVLLRHARNEGVAGHFQLGLHQWAFDVEETADGPHFLIWSPSLRVDVSEWLLSSKVAAEVRAARRPHPAGGQEEYVWVDIRKPLPDEST